MLRLKGALLIFHFILQIIPDYILSFTPRPVLSLSFPTPVHSFQFSLDQLRKYHHSFIMHSHSTLAGLMLSASAVMADKMFVKRDSWGPAFSLGPAKAGIVSTTTTIYPGAMPANQKGYLFAWLGISNGTGDLIQSVIGSYPAGGSECSGPAADTTWCVSSEVYGLASNGYPNQWVGALTTADVNYQNGIKLTYTLADKSTYLWTQTMEDAVTGELLSSFNKTSGPMLGWGTALECDDGDDGTACSGTVQEQIYADSTIVLESADSTFIDTLGAGTGVVYTDMVTADNGLTWTIEKITLPAMNPSGAAASASASSDTSSATASAAVAEPTKKASSKTSSTKKATATAAAASFAAGQGFHQSGSASASRPTATGSFGGSSGGFGGWGGQKSASAAGAEPTGHGHHGKGNHVVRRGMYLGRRIPL